LDHTEILSIQFIPKLSKDALLPAHWYGQDSESPSLFQ